MDVRAGELRKHGKKLRLQEKSFLVLVTLLEHPGALVTREELQNRLWSNDTFVDFEDGLHTAVKKLRDVLGDNSDNPRYIETIRGRGYRFLLPVETTTNGHIGSVSVAVSPDVSQPALDEKLSASPQGPSEHEELKKNSLRRRIGLAIFTAAIVGAVGYWLLKGRPVFSFRSHDTVLLTDFENQTGDPRFDTALGTAFLVSLEQSRYANVFLRLRLESVLARMGKKTSERITPAVGREICQREGIRGLVAISITRSGQEYALSAQLIDPQTGETARSYTEHAYGEDHILDALDVLARETREGLGESLYQIHRANKPLPQVTTRSLTALQQYSEGRDLWAKGKYQDAATLYKAALNSDPDFAMAHAALGRADYSFIFNQEVDGRTEYEKALSLLSRVTDREHMLIEANYAADRKHAVEASQLLRGYLQRYPDDVPMRFNYANLLRNSGHDGEAIEQFKEVLRIAPDFTPAYINLATTFKSRNDLSQALQTYEKSFELDANLLVAGNVNREYGFTLVANGQDEKAQSIFSALLAKPETRENGLRSLAFLDLYHGRYAQAKGRLEQSLGILEGHNSALSVARVHLLLAILAGGTGDVREEKRQLDSATASWKDIQSKAVFGSLLGIFYARAGLTDDAKKMVAVIGPLVDQNNPEQSGYFDLLQGEVALSGGDGESAIHFLERSDTENHTGLSEEALSRGYQQVGRLDSATKAYEHIFQTSNRFLGWEAQQPYLEARYALAQIYLAQGDRTKAQQTLALLLELWKDADKDLLLLKKAQSLHAQLGV